MPTGRTDIATLLFRRGLAATWTSVNPVLMQGEPGYETDTGKVKIGDGTTAWTSLGYLTYRRIISTVSTNTPAGNAVNTDYVYLVSGTTTITLPSAVSNTNRYTIKNIGAGTVTVTSGQTIDGSSSVTISAGVSHDYISDNSNWRTI